MTWYEKLFNWLNGNKTLFGLFLLAVVVPGVPDDLKFWFIPVKIAIEWLGGILAGTGILHKIGKANTEPGPNP